MSNRGHLEAKQALTRLVQEPDSASTTPSAYATGACFRRRNLEAIITTLLVSSVQAGVQDSYRTPARYQR